MSPELSQDHPFIASGELESIRVNFELKSLQHRVYFARVCQLTRTFPDRHQPPAPIRWTDEGCPAVRAQLCREVDHPYQRRTLRLVRVPERTRHRRTSSSAFSAKRRMLSIPMSACWKLSPDEKHARWAETPVYFNPSGGYHFNRRKSLPNHPSGMRFYGRRQGKRFETICTTRSGRVQPPVRTRRNSHRRRNHGCPTHSHQAFASCDEHGLSISQPC
jgi:hypothetical protein